MQMQICRCKYATIYVDQYSRFGFVYLQKTASAEETVKGKKAFEAMSRRHGVTIENYHANNGIFKAATRMGGGLSERTPRNNLRWR
jgi:hypothetical protein